MDPVIVLNGKIVEQVRNFKYWDSEISSEGEREFSLLVNYHQFSLLVAKVV